MMRILYVEDDPSNVSLVERIASMGHHEVVGYEAAEDALEYFEDDRPDIVLADFSLAGNMNGLEMVRRLRMAGYRMPIVAVTAIASKRECLEAGCDEFFAKPLPVNDFWELLQRYDA